MNNENEIVPQNAVPTETPAAEKTQETTKRTTRKNAPRKSQPGKKTLAAKSKAKSQATKKDAESEPEESVTTVTPVVPIKEMASEPISSAVDAAEKVEPVTAPTESQNQSAPQETPAEEAKPRPQKQKRSPRQNNKKTRDTDSPIADDVPSPTPVAPVANHPSDEEPLKSKMRGGRQKGKSDKKVNETDAETAAGTPVQAEAAVQEVADVVPPQKNIQIESKPVIRNIFDLIQAPQRNTILSEQQIKAASPEELDQHYAYIAESLANVLDYDIVISDTNIWIELSIDPRGNNTKMQYEHQLEFISKMMARRGRKFIILSETFEEIDRFACMQEPVDHKDADWSDSTTCLNAAARLSKRLILNQLKENRLKILNIGSESHHSAFADPAIVRKVAELFAEGKKVLLLTNDTSVAIRSLAICDDLQRHNNISDDDWNKYYLPQRPMVFTFDDLKALDPYTRQYHHLQMATGKQWMDALQPTPHHSSHRPMQLWKEAFRPGDKYKNESHNANSNCQQKQRQKQQGQNNNQPQNSQGQSSQSQNNQVQGNQQNHNAQNGHNVPKDNESSKPVAEQTGDKVPSAAHPQDKRVAQEQHSPAIVPEQDFIPLTELNNDGSAMEQAAESPDTEAQPAKKQKRQQPRKKKQQKHPQQTSNQTADKQ